MKSNKREIIFVLIVTIAVGIALAIPTGFEKEEYYKDIERVPARVLEVDDRDVFATGVLKTGHQRLKIRILSGSSKGVVLDEVQNGLSGKLEQDKFFAPGDKLLLTIKYEGNSNQILYTNVVDHYRINVEIILAVLYLGALVALSGWTGCKAALSFVFSIVCIWKILLPSILKGNNAVFTSLIIVFILTFVIIFLVAGFTKKGMVAFFGAVLGIGVTSLLSVSFGRRFMLDGTVLPYTEALFYAGHTQINLTDILYASIFISSSGAVTDIAMDIASALDEIKEKRPDISPWELMRSGLTVSKALIGTMTTTLLLAYSGSYMTTMMAFIANGTPLMNVLNMRYVSSEILTTLVGSFGLVLVAPFTSIVGGLVYSRAQGIFKNECL